MESLLKALLEEQRKTNQLLSELIEALSEGPDESDDGQHQPLTYMDGTRVEPPTVEFIGRCDG